MDGKWEVGGFTDEACMWSFRTAENTCELPVTLLQYIGRCYDTQRNIPH